MVLYHSFASDNVSWVRQQCCSITSIRYLWINMRMPEEIATTVVTAGIQQYVSCSSFNRNCAEQFLLSKGTEIFRRPLSNSDVENYLEMYDLVEEDGFDEAMIWVITSLLQSPHFLYRSELGERVESEIFALTSWEMLLIILFFHKPLLMMSC